MRQPVAGRFRRKLISNPLITGSHPTKYYAYEPRQNVKTHPVKKTYKDLKSKAK